MTRRFAVGVVTVLGALVFPAGAWGSGFTYGVNAGDVTSSSAILWTRADQPGSIRLQVATSPTFPACGMPAPAPSPKGALSALPANDLTVQLKVTGLEPDSRYWYRFCSGATASDRGRFRTAPSRKTGKTIRFGLTGDADGAINPATGQPAYNRFEVFGRMAGERNAFNVDIGDVMYSDSAVAGVSPALSLEEKWAKYKLNLSYPNLLKLRASAGVYSHWDDHEFVDDFSVPVNGIGLYQAGVKAFRDYNPVRYRRSVGLYRSFKWGRNLELFFLDERSFRSAPASVGGVCGDSRTGLPDPFPLLPQAVRQRVFGLPGLGTVTNAAACIGAITDPTRTMLGKPQLAAFERAITRSKATWKVVVNEVPIQNFYFQPYDRWEGYAAERTQVLGVLRREVKNVVFLTTDLHGNMIGDVRRSNVGSSASSPSVGKEVITGPVALKTFAVDTDLKARPGTARVISDFFKTPQPFGLGLSCAALDVYSYVEVRVSARRVTVAPRDATGQPVREFSGAPCRALVVRAHGQGSP